MSIQHSPARPATPSARLTPDPAAPVPIARAGYIRDAEAGIVDRAAEALSRCAAGRPYLNGLVKRGDADSETLLRRVIDDELARLHAVAPDDDVSPAEHARLIAELQEVYLDLRELRLRRRMESYERAQEGLDRLRNVADPATLLDRVTREVCGSCGFERGVLSRIDGSDWILAGAHFQEHEDWAEEFVRFGSQTRPELTHTMVEARMARRQSPALVADAPNDPRTHKPFVEHSGTRSYVGAPIIPRGRVIGFFHADNHFSGRAVDGFDRDTLWAFTAGFAYVYERAVLLERLREQRRRIEGMVTSTSAAVDALCESDVDPERLERDRTLLRSPTTAFTAGGRVNPALLTPREIEVLSLMAAGATNAAIARELFISEGTVKSHVKRILRKLDASNRAQAVSRYLRSQAERPHAPTMPLAG